MTHLRARGLKRPLIGGLIGLGGLGGLLRVMRHRSKRHPSAAELLSLDDEAFDAFIRAKHLRTATDIGAAAVTTD